MINVSPQSRCPLTQLERQESPKDQKLMNLGSQPSGNEPHFISGRFWSFLYKPRLCDKTQGPQCRNHTLKALLIRWRMDRTRFATKNARSGVHPNPQLPIVLIAEAAEIGRLSPRECPLSPDNCSELCSVSLAVGSCRHGEWKCRHILALL